MIDNDLGENEDAASAVSTRLTRNHIFEILSSERRRMILTYMEDREGPVQLRELATHIAATEEEKEESDLSDDEIRRVYISLYQYHVPKMSDLGIISYDRDAGAVTLEDPSELLFPYLELDPMQEIKERGAERSLLASARSWFKSE